MHQSSETLLKTCKFTVVRLHGTSPAGKEVNRDCIRHSGAVTIIPLVGNDQVCLIRSYRATVNETLIELPAGTLDPGELPLDTAARELTEETGYRAGQIREIRRFYMSPGILDERMVLCVAEDLSAGEPKREPTEEIENYVVSWDEAMRLVDDGEIRDAKSLVGLLAYDRMKRS